MKEKVFLFLSALLNGSFAQFVLLLTLILVVLVGVINIFFSIFLTSYGAKKRIIVWLYTPVISALCILAQPYFKLQTFLFLNIVSLIFNLPVFLIREKKPKIIETEPREIIKFIDRTIKNTPKDVQKSTNKADESRYEKPVIKLNLDSKKPDVVDEKPDYSHVKNVIARLWEYPLTQGDKKQLKELENAIILIENSDNPCYALNDELGALLKIMAKYGV